MDFLVRILPRLQEFFHWVNSFSKQPFDSGTISFFTSLFQNCSVSISKLRLHLVVAIYALIVFVQEAEMNVDAENSTNSLFDTTRRSAELLIDNYPLGYVGITLTFALLVGGFISNCVLFDVLRRQNNSTLVWVTHLVCWNNVYLALNFFDAALRLVTQIQLAHFSRIACKAFRFLALLVHCAPLLHLAAIFVDQALFLTNPTWHYKQNWKKEIPKISAAVTLYCLLYSSPMVFINDIRVDSCETIFLPLWEFLYTFNFLLLSSLVASSNIVFIIKLRQNRMSKNDDKLNSSVATNGEKNDAEPRQKQKFSFSAEDMKAVKFMLFFFLGTLLLVLTIFLFTFLDRLLVKTRSEVDIIFWLGIGWMESFIKGVFILLIFSSKELIRKLIINRYFK